MRKILILFCFSLLLCSCSKNSGSGLVSVGGEVNSGSGSDSESADRLNFDCAIGFDDDSFPTYYDSSEGLYHFNIIMGWSVGADAYTRGVSQIGLEIYSSDGIDNGNTSGGSGGVRIETNGRWKYFSGQLFRATSYSWSELVMITSRNPSVSIEYRCRLYDSQTNSYVTSDWTRTQTFTYQPL